MTADEHSPEQDTTASSGSTGCACISSAETKERWRQVQGWPLYKVSSFGRVRGRWGRLLRPTPNARGYLAIGLNRAGKKKLTTVHQLVLRAFVGPKPAGMMACHNDGNPANNALSNLRWGTAIENARDRDLHGRTARGEKGRAKLKTADVLEIRHEAKRGESFESLGRKYGVSGTQIRLISKGASWKHIPLKGEESLPNGERFQLLATVLTNGEQQ